MTRSEAAQQGRKRYFTGEPCKAGHIAERQTSNGGCIMCMNPLKAQTHATSKHTTGWAPKLQAPSWFTAPHFELATPVLQRALDDLAYAWVREAHGQEEADKYLAVLHASINPTTG